MSEPKPFASLSSSLLARKGSAKPAMRPQGFAGFGMVPVPAHDDLGWNDMGHDPVNAQPVHSADVVPILPMLAATHDHGDAPEPVVMQQRETLAREMAPAVAMPFKPRAAAGSKGKAAFTLRLDPDRHLKLRLTCAVHHKSAQQLVIHALDLFLDGQPEVAQLAAATQTKR